MATLAKFRIGSDMAAGNMGENPSRREVAAMRVHDLRQPLNIIRLASGNIRARLLRHLGPEDAAYLTAKLESIDAEAARAADLADQLAEMVQSAC